MKCNQLLKRLFSCHTGYFFLLFLVSLLGYGAFLKYAPIYDFNNFFFPYRYSVVDAIHQHCLPFWNPYQAMGIPAHADPQSGVFYLPVWLFALIFGKESAFYRHFFYLKRRKRFSLPFASRREAPDRARRPWGHRGIRIGAVFFRLQGSGGDARRESPVPS